MARRRPPVTETLSDLTEVQRSHMAFRLDRNTGYGLGTIGAVMRGEKGDMPILEVFTTLGMTPHQAIIHARRVLAFGDEEIERKYEEHVAASPFRGAAEERATVNARFAGFRAAKAT